MLVHDEQFIGGRWVRATGGEWLELTSPITEQVFGRVPVPTFADIDAAIDSAREAFDNLDSHRRPGHR